tara:strand:+ start:205 stop:765 length:561 start_codon:yes stop_codon:yes gene_type:complete
MENKSLVYAHKDPKTLEIYYIGKGTLERAYSTTYSRRSKMWFKLREENGNPIVEILKDNLTSDEALELEKEYIQLYGRLINGSGSLINIKLGNSVPKEYCAMMAITNKDCNKGRVGTFLGKNHSKETLKKMWGRNNFHPEKGIRWVDRTRRFELRRHYKGKRIYVGGYHTKAEAIEAGRLWDENHY